MILLREVFLGGWHKFASSFSQAPITGFPFFHPALPFPAVKLAKGRVLRDLLDKLVPEPPPDPANWLVTFQLLSPTRRKVSSVRKTGTRNGETHSTHGVTFNSKGPLNVTSISHSRVTRITRFELPRTLVFLGRPDSSAGQLLISRITGQVPFSTSKSWDRSGLLVAFGKTAPRRGDASAARWTSAVD